MPMRLIAGLVPFSLLLTPSTLAFASLPPGTSPHDEITRAAAKEADYPRAGRTALLEAVRAPDLQDMEWEPSTDHVVALGFSERYDPAHHCDRLLPADDTTSFQSAVDYIAHERQAAASHIANGNATDAVRALGHALHALQDCFSHTNAPELGNGSLLALEHALLDGAAMPDGLRLGALSRQADSPGDPDDPYAHDQHAKDTPHYNDVAQETNGTGISHFDLAKAAATSASTRVIASFLDGLDDAQRQQLAEVSAADTQHYLDVLNARTVVTLLAVLLGVGLATYAGIRLWRAR